MTDKKDNSEIKILLGEDDFINRHITAEHIKKHGFKVISVENGKEAIKAIGYEKPDLVLMDCYMPEMSGFEAATYISDKKESDEFAADLPVIAITGDATDKNKERIKIAGFDDMVEKPFDDSKFIKIVKKWLKIDLHDQKQAITKTANEAERSLKNDFYKRLEGYLNDLPAFLKDPSNLNVESLEIFSKTIHNCIGAPGMFGYHEISNLAISLNEELLSIIAKNENPISTKDLNALGNLTSILVEEIGSILLKKDNIKTQLFFDSSKMGHGKNILIVDDDNLMTEVLEKKLKDHSFNVIISKSGEDAIEQIGKNNIDLMMLDYQLPGIDGYQVLETLHEDNAIKGMPVIIITAMQDKRNMIKGMSLGITDFVTKPFDAEDIVERVIKATVGNKIRALVIDDDELILSLIKDRLDKNGFSIDTTLESDMAIEIARNTQPDIIILDRMMPRLDGDSVLKLLKNDKKTKDIPVIFLTALNRKEDMLESYKEGVEDYIVKPFKIKDLTQAIIKIVTN